MALLSNANFLPYSLLLLSIFASEFLVCNVAAECEFQFQNDILECGGAPVALASRWGPSDRPTDLATIVISLGAIIIALVVLCYCCQCLSCWTSKEHWTAFDEHHRQQENFMFWRTSRRPVEDDSVSIEERTTTTTATASSTPSSDPQTLSAPLNPDLVVNAKVSKNKKQPGKFGDCVIDMCTVF